MKKTSKICGFIALLLLGSSAIIDSLSVILAFAAVIPTMLCFLSLCAPEQEKEPAVEKTVIPEPKRQDYDWIENTFSPVWDRIASRKRNTKWLEKTFGNLFLRLAEDNTPR